MFHSSLQYRLVLKFIHSTTRIESRHSKVVCKPSPDSVNRQWRHELHDVKSVFWLLLYWVVLAQPAQLGKEEINANIWTGLMGSSVKLRTGLLRSLCAEKSLEELMHSVYQRLFPLLRNLATILIVDRHWLDESETRNDPEYVSEAFQCLILQFILDHRDEEFMTREVEPEHRKSDQVGQNPNLLSTASSRRDQNNRKRPFPRPSRQRQKRRRLAAEVVMAKVGRCSSLDHCPFLHIYVCIFRMPWMTMRKRTKKKKRMEK